MTARPRAARRVLVTGGLFVDMGQQARGGRWIRPPRARYECLLCHTVEGPVTGANRVSAFVTVIRADHKARCSTGAALAEAA
ncbi:hypothetical protein [Streptomyces sp. NPDC093097]|uniref:hypothetical protein n=1 Tax=Streptomyces sp. NPDC093097 TaxID=3366027 RepID=UPI0038047BC9